MSDNPGNDNEELASLGIRFDSQAFAADIAAAREQVEGFGAAAAQAIQEANTAAQSFTQTMTDGLTQEAQATQNLNEQLKITQQTLSDIQDQQAAMQDAAGTNLYGGEYGPKAQSIGYGAAGGMIGPAEAEDPESVGSLSGVARGLRRVSPDSANILYAVEGFRRLTDIVGELNGIIEASPGLLAPVIEMFTAMGIPLAGLAALGAVVVPAVAGMVIAITSFLNTLKQGADGIAADVKQIQEQAKLAGTGTTPSLRESRDKLLAETGGQQELYDQLKTQRDAYQQKYLKEGGLENLAAAQALDNQMQDLQKQMDENAASVNNYNQALRTQQVDLNNTADAARAAADRALQNQQRLAQYDALGTEQANGQIAKLQAEQTAREQAISILETNNNLLEKTNDSAGKNNYQIDLNDAKLKDLRQAYADAAGDIDYLKNTVIAASSAADEWEQHEKDLADAGKEAAKVEKERADLTKQLADAEDNLVKQTADAKQKELQNEEQYTQGSLEDVQKRLDITTKESRQETDIRQKMADADDDIRTKLLAKLAKDQTDLGRQIQDDTTKYGNDRARMVREEHDTESQNLQDHLRKLADIQNKSHSDDQQALLDRNFLALAKSKVSNQDQINEENTRYARQQADLRNHLSNQEREQDIAFAQQEAKRQLDYQRKRDDDELQAQAEFSQQARNAERKLAAQQRAERQSLQDLTTNETYRIQLLRRGLQEELDLLQQQEKQRIAIIQQSLDSLGGSGAPTGSGARGRINPVMMAGGGDFGAGEPIGINEFGSSGFERVNIGSTSFGTNTAALVIPFGSGSVDANKGGKGVTIHNEWNISGLNGDPEQIVNYAVGKMQDLLESVVD